MNTCFDVAKYILEKNRKPLPAIKLQKLVYYSQAWSLVWDDLPLFGERIEAWINGPVIPDLYKMHREKYLVSSEDITGDPSGFSEKQKETIDKIIDFYGDKNSQWLSDLTHAEEPWKLARRGLALNERGNAEITLKSMAEYYSSLFDDE